MAARSKLFSASARAKKVFYCILIPSTLLSLLVLLWYNNVLYEFTVAKRPLMYVESNLSKPFFRKQQRKILEVIHSNKPFFLTPSREISEVMDSINLNKQLFVTPSREIEVIHSNQLHHYRNYPGSTKFSLQRVLPPKHLSRFNKSKCVGLTKWIVTTAKTTDNSSDVETLLRYVGNEWCVLILGDTNNNTEWLKGKQLIYLNVQQQLTLPFEIGKLPLNTSFHSKNIGFLFAIHEGAQVILDLDSNYVPTKLKGQYFPVFKTATDFTMPVVPLNTERLWNPYPYFGAINSWPRGFPYNRVSTFPSSENVTKRRCLPIVQQYLVSNRPDVTKQKVFVSNLPDMNKQTVSSLFHTDRTNSIAVPNALFAPYNSLATVHLYESFWSLLLPQTVDQRVSDIWRSYIAQHLFHMLPGTCVVFTPPAVQYVSARSTVPSIDNNSQLLTVDLFAQVVEMLDRSSQSMKTFDRESLFRAYVRLYEVGLVDALDVEYSKSWLTDLKHIGYHFPTLKWQSRVWTTNVQLCIMFNLKKMDPNITTINLLLRYYLQFFKHILIIFDGKWLKKPNFIPHNVEFSGCDSKNGWYQHVCLNKCLQQTKMSRDVSGYLFIPDDMFVNLTIMSSFSLSKLWYIKPTACNYTELITKHPADWHWGPPNYFENVLESVIKRMPSEWKNSLNEYGWSNDRLPVRGIFDIVYVPSSLTTKLKKVLTFIIETGDLFCEIAGPLAVEIVVRQSERVILKYGYLWGRKRSIADIVNTARKASFVHPIKLGIPAEGRLWQRLMEKQLFSLKILQ